MAGGSCRFCFLKDWCSKLPIDLNETTTEDTHTENNSQFILAKLHVRVHNEYIYK